jgi:hypothetical protein
VGRRFDLVLSLEVAEHLDPSVADQFVGTLTDLGSTVVFSAAVPFQQGVHHVNLRWPSYWAQLFAARGYSPSVSLRDEIWSLIELDPWYVQNIVAFESDATREIDLSQAAPRVAARRGPPTDLSRAQRSRPRQHSHDGSPTLVPDSSPGPTSRGADLERADALAGRPLGRRAFGGHGQRARRAHPRDARGRRMLAMKPAVGP